MGRNRGLAEESRKREDDMASPLSAHGELVSPGYGHEVFDAPVARVLRILARVSSVVAMKK